MCYIFLFLSFLELLRTSLGGGVNKVGRGVDFIKNICLRGEGGRRGANKWKWVVEISKNYNCPPT